MYIHIYVYIYISSKYFKQPKENIISTNIFFASHQTDTFKAVYGVTKEIQYKYISHNSKHFCFARNEASLIATKFYFSFDIFFILFVFPWTCSRLTNMIIVSRVSPTILSRSWGHSLTRRILTCTIWFCRPVVVSESLTTHRYNTN